MKKSISVLLLFLLIASGAISQTQNVALNKVASQSSTSQWSKPKDAQGAIDGIKNGSFGFHTKQEQNPWWQVDLGENFIVEKILVFNRQDCCADLARTTQVLISKDGVKFKNVANLSDMVYGGVKDDLPLTVYLDDQDLEAGTARFIRIQLNEFSTLHLDEVEVYGRPSSSILPSIPTVVSRPAKSKGITLYEHGNYQGASLIITSDWRASPDWNDRISSIKVPEGYRIKCYEHSDQSGGTMNLTSDWTVSDGDLGFNDFISSIEIVEYPDESSVINPDRLTEGTFYISTRANNKFLDQATGNGPVIFLNGNDKESQQWEIEPAGDGYVNIISKSSSLFLDQLVDKGITGTSKGFNQYSQQWIIQAVGDGYFTITSRVNGKVLYQDLTRSNVPLATANATTAQHFKFIPIGVVAEPAQVVKVTEQPAPVVEIVKCGLTDKQLTDAEKAIRAQNFSDKRMATAKLTLKNKCITISQIRRLAKLFTFENQRLEFVKHTYDLTDEKDAFYTLHDAFTFIMTKDNFNEFVQSKK